MTPVFLFFLLYTVTTIPMGGAYKLIGGSEDAFSIIEAANKKLNHFTEGDIVQNVRRTAHPCVNTGCKWPKVNGVVTVPYVLNNPYNRAQKRLIVNALKVISDNTCVEFVKRKGETDYLFFESGRGCGSLVGRLGGAQPLFLDSNGCMVERVVHHEALHALGFLHEQSRDDRDNHVTIHWENIQEGREPNFRSINSVNFNIPYDYYSVLHYGRTAFSKNGLPTITAKDNYDMVLGGTQMSANDFSRINALYEC